MATPALNVSRLTPHCGAEIRGIDLAKPLDDAVIKQIERTLAEHAVVFFRDQSLTPDEQKAFGRRFGELHVHPSVRGKPRAGSARCCRH